MNAFTEFFPGFETHRIEVGDLSFFVRTGGSGPPLLCLHGFPQCHVCWHRIAPTLAQSFSVVLMDLRGYGMSSVPASDPEHRAYSKRTMAQDAVHVMSALGHSRFHIMGHDRGGRVAYRLALDCPHTVICMVLLDIIPTIEQWDGMHAEKALSAYHWAFLAQPHPLPETLIQGGPQFYLDYTLASWTKSKSLDAFDPGALNCYRALFRDNARIHALCEDYRAGAECDRAIDAEDRAAGRKILAPTLVLWGTDYLGLGAVSPLETWRRWCAHVSGNKIESGHFLAEENSDATVAAILPFLTNSL
ncbi:MAG: alpha/beta fold hydrolase [Hyphomicrobiaceae bacterium]